MNTLFLKKCFRPFIYGLIGLFLVTILVSLSYSLGPYALKELVNSLMDNSKNKNFINIGAIIAFYTLSSLFPMIAFRIHNFIWVNLAPPLRRHITALSVNQALQHPYSFYQNTQGTKIATQIKDLASFIPDIIKIAFEGLLCAFLTLLSGFFVVGSVHYKFSIGLVIWMVVFTLGSLASLKRAKKIGCRGSKLRSKVYHKIVEIFENISLVKIFNRETFEEKKLNFILTQHLIIEKEKERIAVRTFAFQGLSFILYQALCLVWLIEGFELGQMNAGDFVLILTINLSFVDRFRKTSRDLMDFSDLFGHIQQGLKDVVPLSILEEKPSSLLESCACLGEIVFDEVTFSYEGMNPIFSKKSVHIKPNQKIAILGHSGSGKSTFINLMLGLYDISSGEIKIDGKNIKDFSDKELRHMMSLVPQKISLFQGTILDNIRYGRLDATESEVIEAAKKAEIHEFISNLDDGYKTQVNSNVLKLSSGQLQRIGIARAILKDAPIFILDEATSHLDTITESRLRDSLAALMKTKTSIIITHRFSSLLLQMDQIFVFEKGKIVERGTHQKLIANKGLYKTLWEHSGVQTL